MAKSPPSTKWPWLRRDSKRIASGFARVLLYEFDALEEHREFADSSLRQRVKSLESRVNKMIQGMTEEQRDEYYDHVYDEHINVTETLPQMQWYAQFLIVYSTFEHTLHELCRIVERRSGFNLSFKDLDGQGINRARNYLVKLAGVNAPFQSAAWNRALLLADVRNAIAHRNGEIEFSPKAAKSLSARLAKEQHIKLKQIAPDDDTARIVLDGEFVQQSIVELRKVLVDICNYELYES